MKTQTYTFDGDTLLLCHYFPINKLILNISYADESILEQKRSEYTTGVWKVKMTNGN